ncbi:MAG: ATP-binding protein [Chitinophagales bacterium]
MFFKQVIGLEEIKDKLRSMVRNSRLSHAILLTGAEGSGGLPLALAFAQYLVCDRVTRKTVAPDLLFPTASADDGELPVESCGVCPSCVKAAQLIHPDIHYVYPVFARKSGDKPLSADFITEWRGFISQSPYGNLYDWLQHIQAENKQGNISAYECNEINRKLSLKSFEGGYKIQIIWMPEFLGNEGNKLLKLIEEPPPDTLFLLVTENESKILPTILSRLQIIKLPRPDLRDIEQALQTQGQFSADQARKIAAVSQQNYREALRLLQETPEDWQGTLRDWLNGILKSGPVAQVKWIEDISKLGRERQKQFLQYFSHLLEQAIRLRMRAGQLAGLPDSEQDFASRLNRIADVSSQQAIIEEIDKAIYYIERNAHAKMLFHALTIRFYHILHNHEVAVVT